MKRPPGDGQVVTPMGDSKRPKEEVEHQYLMRVLQPAQQPQSTVSVATIGDYLETEAGRLSAQNPASGLEDALQFLAKGWRRAEEGGVVPTTWAGIAPLQEAALTTALMLLLGAGTEEKVRALTALLETPVPARLMNELLSAAAEDEGVPSRLILGAAKPLRDRHLNDQQVGQFAKLLRILRASKRYPAALIEPPCLEEVWKPHFEPKFLWRNRKREVVAKQWPGYALQTRSLLGWALAPSALDGANMPPSKSHLTEAGSPEWSDLSRATRQRIDGCKRGTQMKVASVTSTAAELVDILLRASDANRWAVLEWIGIMLSSAEPRGKQGYVAPGGFNFWPQHGNHVIDVLGHEQTPPFEKSLNNLLLLQSLHAKMFGFPTSGAALNTMTLLLHLCKPIKQDQATSFSAFFPLRKDAEDLMGAWVKEARFGEKEQVEAAEEVAKSDATFAAPMSDKILFKTQVFWLATKGIGTLLLPVVKEAFHTFQNIAGYFVHKDRPNADTAWRQFLLAESTLREPGFLERLGHLVDLTFRFLRHSAAGGQEALPPPAPGPTWHALPSTVLENVIDLCDLYRDSHHQRQASSIPTGLFAHLDPDPLLTTLCVVMASDDHVRDPSLRGRTVKLMHRLCFSFPQWQEKLNQPPLSNHLIPCLINVFIAVEKAILSYYDLAYRYKYELRVPVMDLFELTLQHEVHRKVLDGFVRGVGNERFQKLLTQLINDSNSQTEEAIRTVKEYHQNRANDAAQAAQAPQPGASGGQHDEQVLGDDQTAEGEDVYRRSRMNYKEHAKKYFGLASKTWKTLWLLCKDCAPVIVEGKTILEQLLHTSLDAQLYFLVGPEMKSIKSSPQEYDELGFNPKELVKQIAEIYLFLARINREEVARIVGKDERYYSAATFSKAVRFIRKYNLLGDGPLGEFDALVKDLSERVSQQRAAFDEADIPAEYLCEMMADIMSDPVQFPQSRKIVDRWTAVRQIMSSDRDPYANTPVKVEDLIPLPELKEEIHRFAKEKGIALEGGNMFD